MKVVSSIRRLYEEQLGPNKRLQAHVDQLLRPIAVERRWHHESRVKTEISVALKLESGRIPKPQTIEDFFACTLVVKNLTEVNDAEQKVKDIFEVFERRPQDNRFTHKYPDAFPFDDLRLYARVKADPALPSTGIEHIAFEIQVKTFLQHAWGIATHDLIYKTDEVSWSRQRIAYQIKAMLEHAEISIQEADSLAKTAALGKAQGNTEAISSVIELLKKMWPADSLPNDLKRLAENIRTVMKIANINVKRLGELLEQEKERQKGDMPLNICPYSVVVQAVAWHDGARLQTGLENTKGKEKLLVTQEMDLPTWFISVTRARIVDIV